MNKHYSFEATTPLEWFNLCAEFSARGIDLRVEIPNIGGTYDTDGNPELSHFRYDSCAIVELAGTARITFEWDAVFTIADIEDALMIDSEKRVESARNMWYEQQENSAKLTTKLKGLLVADTQKGGE